MQYCLANEVEADNKKNPHNNALEICSNMAPQKVHRTAKAQSTTELKDLVDDFKFLKTEPRSFSYVTV